MDDKITREKLTKYGFSVEDNEMLDWRKGILEVHLCLNGRVAVFNVGTKPISFIGHISTMHEVEVLDRIINPLPQDAITEERLIEIGFSCLGEGAFNHDRIRLIPKSRRPHVYLVYYQTGDMIGLVVNMTEVKSLVDVTTRRA